jgi:hypothetical protein
MVHFETFERFRALNCLFVRDVMCLICSFSPTFVSESVFS